MYSSLYKLLLIIGSQVLAQVVGPYDLHVYSSGECKDVGSRKFIVAFKLENINKNKAHISGYALLPLGWTDRIYAIARVLKVGKDGNSKKEVFVRNVGGACTAAKTLLPDFAKQLFNALGGYKNCPIAPGNYTVNGDFTFSLGGVPIFIYGKYTVEIDIYSTETSTKLGCFYFNAGFLPKKSSKRKG